MKNFLFIIDYTIIHATLRATTPILLAAFAAVITQQANILNVDVFSGYEEMLYSDEAFAGGISQEHRNGAFGMKLHEHDKYNGSHRARKSFHFFDEVIVCLGSDIENTNNEYPTETTIFQLAVKNDAGHNYWKDYQGILSGWCGCPYEGLCSSRIRGEDGWL